MWAGLDGTSVLTHFCPADTYCAQATVEEVVFSVSNNKDKAYSNRSLLLFGNGGMFDYLISINYILFPLDGGGGPLEPMLDRLERLESIAGLPAKVRHGDPTTFFRELDQTSRDLVTWKGELYFELHRGIHYSPLTRDTGTYTSHAWVKRYNRLCEIALRELELFATLAHVRTSGAYTYPRAEIDRMWKLVLLNQFHDVLPGSSIEIVYDDAWEYYRDVLASSGKLLREAMQACVVRESLAGSPGVFNSTSWSLDPTVLVAAKSDVDAEFAAGCQETADGKGVLFVSSTAPAFSSVGADKNHKIKSVCVKGMLLLRLMSISPVFRTRREQ